MHLPEEMADQNPTISDDDRARVACTGDPTVFQMGALHVSLAGTTHHPLFSAS